MCRYRELRQGRLSRRTVGPIPLGGRRDGSSRGGSPVPELWVRGCADPRGGRYWPPRGRADSAMPQLPTRVGGGMHPSPPGVSFGTEGGGQTAEHSQRGRRRAQSPPTPSLAQQTPPLVPATPEELGGPRKNVNRYRPGSIPSRRRDVTEHSL